MKKQEEKEITTEEKTGTAEIQVEEKEQVDAADDKNEEVEETEEEPEASEESEGPSMEDQLAESKDKYLRLYSEFENFRRRTSKEKLDLINTANKDLLSNLLPVLDDFERALSASEKSDDPAALKEGVELIHTKLTNTLESKGLKKMKVEQGDKFDDEKHEAITQIPAAKKLEGKVVDVIEHGYYLKDAVVRFAKVVVGTKK